MEIIENVIEFINGQRTATVTFSNRKHINRIKKIYSERNSEFSYFHENDDGTIIAKVPLHWIKINPGAKADPNKPKREMTEERKQKLLAGLAKGRAARAKK